MKRIGMTIGIVLCSIIAQAQSPNFNEWLRQKKTQRKYLVQQIAALKVYLEYLKTGYKIVDKGLTAIGDIKGGAFNLDKDYFNSLKQVNPLIRNSPKVNEILVYQQAITSEFKRLIDYCNSDNHYTTGDINYVKAVYSGMLSEGNNAVDELTFITTAAEAEMKDDERLVRLDKVHADVQDQYAFTKDFVAGTKMLGLQRAKEQHEIQSIRKLYTINNP